MVSRPWFGYGSDVIFLILNLLILRYQLGIPSKDELGIAMRLVLGKISWLQTLGKFGGLKARIKDTTWEAVPIDSLNFIKARIEVKMLGKSGEEGVNLLGGTHSRSLIAVGT